ncbi:hypothetical protein R6Q59_031318 [Mikania micrantha]
MSLKYDKINDRLYALLKMMSDQREEIGQCHLNWSVDVNMVCQSHNFNGRSMGLRTISSTGVQHLTGIWVKEHVWCMKGVSRWLKYTPRHTCFDGGRVCIYLIYVVEL